MRKVLVTGGLGYIGSHVVVELQKNNFEVFIIDNLSNSSKKVLDGIYEITGLMPFFKNIDLKDKLSVVDFLNKHSEFDGIIHLASSKAVSESVINPMEYYENNVNSLVNLLSVNKKAKKISFIFSSSCSVYGEVSNLPINEKSPITKAKSPYANTKIIGEQIIKDLCKSNKSFNSIILRYFNAIGAHKSGKIGESLSGLTQNIIPLISKTAIGVDEEFVVYGNNYPTDDGTCIRDYIHVVDLAKAHVDSLIRLIEQKNTNNFDVYNIGTGKPNSVLEVIKAFEKFNNLKLNYSFSKRRAGDVTSAYADVSKANKELGWKSKLSLKDGLVSAWKWHKNNKL